MTVRRMTERRNDYHWWKHGVIYQIYPRSFADASGDGTGDLQGIVSRLPYLADLGIDGLWLSPIFDSPMHDFGYDVRDYRAIHPLFGSLADFDELVDRAHGHGIRIILDLVFNHTSAEHPWFIESRASKGSPKRDWYLWHVGRRFLGLPWRVCRRPPNNWRSGFGGSAWTLDDRTDEYYLHLFLDSQPDLNWRNPDTEAAMFAQARFWLDRGADGFRLDVINYIVKDRKLRSNPYHPRLTFPRRHDQQVHLFDRNQPEAHEILRRFRVVMDEYPETMLVGEVYPNEGCMEPEASASYLGTGNDELHLAFDFSLMETPFRARAYRRTLERWYAAVPRDGWPSHVLSNHDKPRAMTRRCRGSLARARLLATLLLTQRGTPFLYYGEEIGMRDGRLRRHALRDPTGRKYWPFFSGRDRSRTPMQWTAGPNAGFCSADVKPWLPLNTDHAGTGGNRSGVNVDAQREDPDSLLSWYRRLIEARRAHLELTHGSIEFVDSHPRLLVYTRGYEGRRIAVTLNFSSRRLSPPDGVLVAGARVLISTHESRANAPLEPYEARVVSI